MVMLRKVWVKKIRIKCKKREETKKRGGKAEKEREEEEKEKPRREEEKKKRKKKINEDQCHVKNLALKIDLAAPPQRKIENISNGRRRRVQVYQPKEGQMTRSEGINVRDLEQVRPEGGKDEGKKGIDEAECSQGKEVIDKGFKGVSNLEQVRLEGGQDEGHKGVDKASCSRGKEVTDKGSMGVTDKGIKKVCKQKEYAGNGKDSSVVAECDSLPQGEGNENVVTQCGDASIERGINVAQENAVRQGEGDHVEGDVAQVENLVNDLGGSRMEVVIYHGDCSRNVMMGGGERLDMQRGDKNDKRRVVERLSEQEIEALVEEGILEAANDILVETVDRVVGEMLREDSEE